MHKKVFLSFIIFSGLIIHTCLQAQPKGYRVMKDTASFRKKFNEKSKQITTNEADFSQEKYVSVITEKVISKGKFYFKKNNLMRWEYTSPSNNVIVLNNGKMMIKEKGKVKVYDATSNKMFKGLNDMMLTTGSGNILNSKEYTCKLYENERFFFMELYPVNKMTKKYIKRIDIVVEKSDYTVNNIKMVEPNDDYTSIDFTNKKINQGINDDKFKLQ